MAGSLLEEIVRDGAHHGLVDLALEEAHRWLTQNEETFVEIVRERAPWWSPAAVNERVTHRLHLEVVAWVDDIRRDPYHHARGALDSALAQLADDLLHDPADPGAHGAAQGPGARATRSCWSPRRRCGTRSGGR